MLFSEWEIVVFTVKWGVEVGRMSENDLIEWAGSRSTLAGRLARAELRRRALLA